jgi:fatty-acyl-CoA synthase
MNVADCLRVNARNHPNKVAIHEGELSLTYQLLNQRVNQLAHGLMSFNIKKGTIVGIVLPSGHEHLETIYALGKIGAIALPIDDRWGSGEIERTVDHFDAWSAIFHGKKVETFSEVKKEVPKLEGPLICTGETSTQGIINYERLISQSPDSEPECAADEHDTLLIALSSGTTGIPKGVVLTHRNMIFRFLTQIVELGFNPSDIYLNVTPMHHGGGRSFCMCHLFVGGRIIVLGGRFDPGATQEAIQNERITTCFMVPTMYHRVLQIPDVEHYDTSSLRALITSGSPIHESVRRKILEKLTPNFYDYYATVDGGGISLLKPQDILRKRDSVGQGVFNTEIRIVDEEGREVPPGAIGEVTYTGPGTAREYYKNPDATRECFVGGWFHPGDLAKMDGEGFLYIVGRKKDMIIRGGVNIYPPEIEEILHSHPSIFEAVVIGVPDEEYGEEIAAFVVLKPDREASKDQIVQFCKRNLAPYKRPKWVEFVTSLPKPSSGKVDKRQLRERYLRDHGKA